MTRSVENKKKKVWLSSQNRILPGVLPLTFNVAECSASPTSLTALQVYVPECSDPTPGRINRLIFDAMLFTMNLEDEIISMPSLYHWRFIGSSPAIRVHGTWRG